MNEPGSSSDAAEGTSGPTGDTADAFAVFDDPNFDFNPAPFNTTGTQQPHTQAPSILDADLDDMHLEDRILLAIKAVGDKVLSINKAAEYYRIPRTTLQQRVKGRLARKPAHEHQQALSPAEENLLGAWLKVLGKRGVPLTTSLVRDYAAMITKQPIGKTWPERFRQRHPDLKIKWTSGLDKCRTTALNPTVVNHHFDLLEEIIQKYDIKTKNIYNMDEKGVQLGIARRQAVLVDRDQKDVYMIQDGSKELITIIECVCADGTALNPTVIFQAKRRDLKWGEVNPCSASISISPKGWTDQELGSLWVEKDFGPQTEARLDDPGEYRLLILDGHNSHCTFRFCDYAQRHRIIVYCLPPHTTHALQPCDVGVFNHLSRAWKTQVCEAQRDFVQINKYNFLAEYSKARSQAMTESIITGSFRNTGISPLDRGAVPKSKFEPAKAFTTQSAQPIGARLSPLLLALPSRDSVSLPPSNDVSPISSTPTSLHSSPMPSAAPSPRSPRSPLSIQTSPPPSTMTSHVPAPPNSRASINVASNAITVPAPPTSLPEYSRATMQALYNLALPSPVRKTASRSAILEENAQLRAFARAAGVEIGTSYLQMQLMEHENERLRKIAFKPKQKKVMDKDDGDGHGLARHLTAEENMKKLQDRELAMKRAAMAKELKETLKMRRKPLDEEATQRATSVAKLVRAIDREKAKKRKAAEKAQKAAEKAAERAARGGGQGRGTRARGGRVRGARGGRGGRARAQEKGSDIEGEDSSTAGESFSGLESDDSNSAPSPPPSPTPIRSRPRPRRIMPNTGANVGPGHSAGGNSAAPVPPEEASIDDNASQGGEYTGSDLGDTEDDISGSTDGEEEEEEPAEEVGVVRFNGHRWIAKTLQFHIVWDDGDTTWTSMSSDINDLEAMDEYLRHHDIVDPLKLSKRKYLIDIELDRQ